MRSDIKILVACHKECLTVKDDIYLPIHVGKAISNKELGIQCDNTGVNISEKNPLYCEMTAWYWAWKNLKADYVGLCHYRRYFTFESLPFKQKINSYLMYYRSKVANLIKPGCNYAFSPFIKFNDGEQFKSLALHFSETLKSKISDKEYDVVLPRPWELSNSNAGQQFIELGRDHLIILDEIMKEKYPTLYPFYKKTLRSNKLYAANMVIFKYSLFTEYCDFVFSILEEHERRLVSSKFCISPYEEKCCARISGYLAELLSNMFIQKIIAEKKNILYTNAMFLE